MNFLQSNRTDLLFPLPFLITKEIRLLYINIQVADENNGTFSKSFIISVLNVVEDFDLDGIEDAYDPDDDNDGFSDLDRVAYGSIPLMIQVDCQRLSIWHRIE